MPGHNFQDEAEKPMNHRFLERPRVDRILERAMQSHIVTVIAGEGSGKTYAVNSFLQKTGRKYVWIQLSKQDNQAWHSWENYIRGVARINPEAAKILFDIGFPESDRQYDRYLSLLKDELISPAEPYVLVFDDSHLVTSPSALAHIDRALTIPVSKNTVVFISRAEPAINTLSLLSKGLLTEITLEDLRFTREETDAYFRLHQVFLEEGELARIFDKTEGWALALSLILHEIRTADSGGRSWDRVMRPVRKMEERIFLSMGEKLQKFLVKLSLLEYWPRNLLE
ncbi:MAG: helix-turn-helix transcriptional regulator, partial [Treponema sp.]|nr:helix-turn-helix transcriptional regulator [Treponema sp.]